MNLATRNNPFRFFTDFTEQSSGDEFVIPAELEALNDEALNELHDQAFSHFETLYGDGKDLTADELEALEALTDSLERIQAEVATRQEAASQRAEKAAELAARVRPATAEADPPEQDTTETGETVGDIPDPDGGGSEEEESGGDELGDLPPSTPPAEEEPPVSVAASTRVPMSRVRARASRQPKRVDTPAPASLADVMTASVDGPGFLAGQGIEWNQAGQIVDKHLSSFKPAMYETAARANRHVSQTSPIATLTRPKPAELTIHSNDPDEIERVLKTAVDESRIPGGSLTAAGGWCAPSETYYDLTEMEGRDGLLSLPEIRVNRGGFKRTLGPDFKDLFQMGYGFVYTEQQDIDGDYGTDAFGIGNDTPGSKPCVRVPCTEWEEFRLGVDGICVSAGLLMQKGYPELIARTIRGVLVGHDHIQSGRYIKRMVDNSDPVTMPAPPGGAIAPLLDAIALQGEHMRSIRRIRRNTTLEAKFPMWVHGMVRSDLAKRTGVDVLNITDAQINAWFTARSISPQFLYNWQDVEGEAANFTGWPQTVTFLMYPAGTWVKGGDDIINLSNLMDSQLLGQNDYIATFTEESWLLAKMGFDSRVITVPVCANGATAAAIPFDCPPGPVTTTTTTVA